MMKEKEFYDEIANWDFSDIKYETIKETDWDFYKEIRKYVSENSLSLDLGTGGGEKVIKQYPEKGIVIATDFSAEMIKTANKNLEKSNRRNIKFTQMNNLKITFPNGIFDVISARHTITNAEELFRVLKKNGVVIIQGVDKDDCHELKRILGRGQAYNDKKAISEIDYENLIGAGFKIIKRIRVEEKEFYKTKEDLLALLLKTPILDDFSAECKQIEKELLEKYVSKYSTEKGILLNRVLYGIVAIKE